MLEKATHVWDERPGNSRVDGWKWLFDVFRSFRSVEGVTAFACTAAAGAVAQWGFDGYVGKNPEQTAVGATLFGAMGATAVSRLRAWWGGKSAVGYHGVGKAVSIEEPSPFGYTPVGDSRRG